MKLRRTPAPEPQDPLDPEVARQLLAVERREVFPGVPAEARTRFSMLACQHCGGVHARNCPAVKVVEYHPDGKVKRVEFWPAGEWPEDEVLWLADVQAAADAGD